MLKISKPVRIKNGPKYFAKSFLTKDLLDPLEHEIPINRTGFKTLDDEKITVRVFFASVEFNVRWVAPYHSGPLSFNFLTKFSKESFKTFLIWKSTNPLSFKQFSKESLNDKAPPTAYDMLHTMFNSIVN